MGSPVGSQLGDAVARVPGWFTNTWYPYWGALSFDLYGEPESDRAEFKSKKLSFCLDCLIAHYPLNLSIFQNIQSNFAVLIF